MVRHKVYRHSGDQIWSDSGFLRVLSIQHGSTHLCATQELGAGVEASVTDSLFCTGAGCSATPACTHLDARRHPRGVWLCTMRPPCSGESVCEHNRCHTDTACKETPSYTPQRAARDLRRMHSRQGDAFWVYFGCI